MKKLHHRKAAILFVLLCVLLDILGVGLIIPVLPQLVGELAGSKDAQAWWLGAMITSYGLMQFICAPILGALSDHYGRRPVLLVGIAGLFLMFVVPAVTLSLPIILVSRIIGGACAANITAAQAYIADITTKDKRAAAFGMLGACFGTGFILGPALGGLLGEIDVRLPFVVAAGLTVINFFYGLLVLPESLPATQRRAITTERCNPLTSLRNLTRARAIGSLLFVVAATHFCQAILHSTWTLYSDFRYGWTPMDIGLSMVLIGLGSVLMQGFAMRRFIAWQGQRRFVQLSLGAGSIVFFCIGLAHNTPQALAAIALMFFMAGAAPALSALISESVESDSQGQAMGSIASLNSLMGVLAPLFGTPLLVHTAHQNPHSPLAGLIYFICALILLGCTIAVTSHFRSSSSRP